jgi:hypothetical protein
MKHGTWNKNTFALDIPVNYCCMFYATCSMIIVLYFPKIKKNLDFLGCFFGGGREKILAPCHFLLGMAEVTGDQLEPPFATRLKNIENTDKLLLS